MVRDKLSVRQSAQSRKPEKQGGLEDDDDNDSNSSDSLDEVHWRNCRNLIVAHRDKCARARDYEAAAVAEARLTEVKQGEAKWRKGKKWRQEMERIGLRTTSDTSCLAMAKANVEEQRLFADEWCNKIEDFDIQVGALEKDFIRWQTEERRAQNLNQPNQAPCRQSRKVIELRKKASALAKQERYAEAARAKQTMEEVQARERDAWESKTDEHPATKFACKQQMELQAFQRNLQGKREKLATTQKTELDQLLQSQCTARRKLESELGRLRSLSGDSAQDSKQVQPRPKRVQSCPRDVQAARSRPASASVGCRGTIATKRPNSAAARVVRSSSRPLSAAIKRPIFSTAVIYESGPFFRGCV